MRNHTELKQDGIFRSSIIFLNELFLSYFGPDYAFTKVGRSKTYDDIQALRKSLSLGRHLAKFDQIG